MRPRTRAVAPDPSVGRERGRGVAMASVSSPSGRIRVDTSASRRSFPYASTGACRSRTSWRSNTSDFFTASPRGTGRSPSPGRHCLRPYGFLLRPSTAGVLRPAFVALRLPAEVQLSTPSCTSRRSWCLGVREGSEMGNQQGAAPSRSFPVGFTRPRCPNGPPAGGRFRQRRPSSCRET